MASIGPDWEPVIARQRVNTYRQIHNAPPLAYHEGLALAAQASAEYVLESGVSAARQRALGENVLVFSSVLQQKTATALALDAVDAWYEGFQEYDFTAPGVTDMETEQFTRLVWKDTRRVGFGVARTSSAGGTAVVVAAFDPPGNRPGEFATNVLPPGVEHLVLDDYYTKAQSDDRFLSADALDAYVQMVEDAAVQAAEDRVADVEADLASNYYTRLQTDDKFIGRSEFDGFSNALVTDYYTRTAVDDRLSNVQDAASSNLDAFSNLVYDAVNSNYAFVSNVSDRLDGVDASLGSQVARFDAFSNYVVAEYYDKDEADALFATIATTDALASNLDGAYYTKDESDALFATQTSLGQYSNYVAGAYYTRATSDTRFASASEYASLSNAVATEYYDKAASDAKFAGKLKFQALSNTLADDYYAKTESVDLFAARSNLDALATEIDTQYYTQVESDARFASASNLADTQQDLAGLSNVHAAFEDALRADVSNLQYDTRGVRNDAAGLLFDAHAHDDTSNVRFVATSNVTVTDPDDGTTSTFTSNLELLRVTRDGVVGIGSSDPEYKLHVAGEVFAAGGFVQASDSNLKRDIRPITGAVAKLRGIGGYTFAFAHQREKEEASRIGARHAGVLAQEVAAVFPEAVSMSARPHPVYGVAYGDVVALLVEAVKELAADRNPRTKRERRGTTSTQRTEHTAGFTRELSTPLDG